MALYGFCHGLLINILEIVLVLLSSWQNKLISVLEDGFVMRGLAFPLRCLSFGFLFWRWNKIGSLPRERFEVDMRVISCWDCWGGCVCWGVRQCEPIFYLCFRFRLQFALVPNPNLETNSERFMILKVIIIVAGDSWTIFINVFVPLSALFCISKGAPMYHFHFFCYWRPVSFTLDTFDSCPEGFVFLSKSNFT